MIGNRPWSLSHMWCPATFGLGYLIFNFIYIYILKGTNVNGEPYVYTILDWNDESRNAKNHIFINQTENGEYQVFFKNGTFIGTQEEFYTKDSSRFDYYDFPKTDSNGLSNSILISLVLCMACPIFYAAFYGLAKLRDWLWRKKYNEKPISPPSTELNTL